MKNYETLMLARTEITDDEISSLERKLDKIVSSCKGKMTIFDKWGKYKLAYPVKKNVYGIYLLSRCQIPADQVDSFFKEVDTLFRIKYNELVMRHVTVRLAEDVPSSYKYPEPVGSHRTSNLDSFIKENKMEGLIGTTVEKKSAEKKGEEEKEEPIVEKEEKTEEPAEVVEEVEEESTQVKEEE